MARIHAKRKGKSGSVHPMRKKHPNWSALNPREIEAHIVELAKSGQSTSEIGITLRDQYAVPDVTIATGKKVTQILEKSDMKPELPEDLENLVNKTVQLRKHLEQHKNDLKNKRNLHLIESKIWRLTKYYQRQNRLPKGWKYGSERTQTTAQ